MGHQHRTIEICCRIFHFINRCISLNFAECSKWLNIFLTLECGKIKWKCLHMVNACGRNKWTLLCWTWRKFNYNWNDYNSRVACTTDAVEMEQMLNFTFRYYWILNIAVTPKIHFHFNRKWCFSIPLNWREYSFVRFENSISNLKWKIIKTQLMLIM